MEDKSLDTGLGSATQSSQSRSKAPAQTLSQKVLEAEVGMNKKEQKSHGR